MIFPWVPLHPSVGLHWVTGFPYIGSPWHGFLPFQWFYFPCVRLILKIFLLGMTEYFIAIKKCFWMITLENSIYLSVEIIMLHYFHWKQGIFHILGTRGDLWFSYKSTVNLAGTFNVMLLRLPMRAASLECVLCKQGIRDISAQIN